MRGSAARGGYDDRLWPALGNWSWPISQFCNQAAVLWQSTGENVDKGWPSNPDYDGEEEQGSKGRGHGFISLLLEGWNSSQQRRNHSRHMWSTRVRLEVGAVAIYVGIVTLAQSRACDFGHPHR